MAIKDNVMIIISLLFYNTQKLEYLLIYFIFD